MSGFAFGSLFFSVDHRNPGPEGGPTLRVCEGAATGRELLRFDCFSRSGHWHVDPAGRDVVTRLAPELDPIEWTLDRLRQDLAGTVALADAKLELPRQPESLPGVLDAVERALRNPPAQLDAVRPEMRRPSHGEKWTLYPEDVLPAWVADMDFPVAEPIRRVLSRAVERSDLGYPIHPAPTDLPALTAERMSLRFGWRPEVKRVEVLTDVVQGLYVALHRFSEPGQGVVVQTPIYPPFLSCVREMGRRLVENPLRLDEDGYRVDLDGLAGSIDDQTRILMLCNPHNPSGRAFTRNELEGIAEIAQLRDLVVVSDEIHGDLVYSGAHHLPFASLSPEVEARTVTLTAASKAFNIAGLRCAVAIFGSDELKRRFCGLPRHLRGGVGLPGIEATRAAWRHAQPWLDQVLAYLEANRDFLTDFVTRELPGIRLHAPEATYLAWLDCRERALAPSPYRFFLERARVALSDGPAFGRQGEGFVRLNFATSRAILTELLERMAAALRS